MIFPTGSFSVTKASKVATELLRRPAGAGRRFFVDQSGACTVDARAVDE
jgi:hypothetical protein